MWLGHDEGTWLTKAYRGEYFVYQWKGDVSEIKLVAAKDLPQLTIEGQVFIHSETSLDEKILPFTANSISTSNLLKSFPEKIFRVVMKGMQKESYYFRAPEDEFRMNP
jgi:tRNA threonylcarbamoyladenosine biosynthesis protein TsaB